MGLSKHIWTKLNSCSLMCSSTGRLKKSYTVCARSLFTFSEKNKLPTSEEVRTQWNAMTDYVKENFRADPDKFLKLITTAIPETQEELPQRNMKDSYREVLKPLGKNKKMQLEYLNANNSIRFGKILEDLDSFAGVVSYNYYQNPKFGAVCPIPIVTALVDRIELGEHEILATEDIRLNGYVSWVGKSSIEVTMCMEQERNNQWLKMLDARILMVARHPITQRSTFINPLVRNTAEEKEIFDSGEARNRKRKEDSKKSLLKVPPNELERELIHKMFLETIDVKSGSLRVRVKPENCVWMHNTLLKNLTICFPEQRNILNKIFGGFVMRIALELAWANASTYSKCRPLIKAVGNVNFKRPVEIGSLLYMSSQILYTEGSKLLMKVHAEVVDPETQSRETTNEFHFTFDTQKSDLPCVIPQTYSETMLFLDGKRHYEEHLEDM